MNRRIYLQKSARHYMRVVGTALLVAALLAGLFPPPLITGTATRVADLTGLPILTSLADRLPEAAVAQAQSAVFSANFENTSGDNNWTFVGGSTDGNWEIGSSQQSSYVGGIIQLTPYAGSGALVTGLTGNTNGTNDTDGTSIARSPTFTIPADAISAEFSAYGFLGHSSDADTGDSLVVDVYRASDDVKIGTVINEIATIGDNRILNPSGSNSGYTFYSSSMDAFIGMSIYFQVESIDINQTSYSVVEGGLDNVQVTAETPVSGQISGSVYNDLNKNGTLDASEGGISGVLATAYDDTGNAVGNDTTDSSGSYNITGLTDSVQYRIEFTNLPVGYASGPFGSQSSTSIAFATPPDIVRLGLTTAAAGCDPNNARYFVSCFINGDPTHSSNVGETGIASFGYITSGFVQSTDSSNTYEKIANMDVTGPVWGLAYDEMSGALYSSAVVKRHSGAGPDGIGAIYVQNDLTDPASATLFHDFGADAGTIDTNATRFPGSGTGFGQEGPCKACDNVDPDAFGWAGQRSFGDIDISNDGSTLYVVNLNDRKLYSVNTAGTPTHTEVPSAPWLDNAICPNNSNGTESGVARPWAVTVDSNDDVYVGAVCDASTSTTCGPTGSCSHLGAVVYRWDGAAWTTAMPLGLLNYSRDLYVDGGAGSYWHPWATSYAQIKPYIGNITDAQYPQPVLADIEFADDDHMILGFISLSGLQLGYDAPAPDAGSGDTSIRYFAAGDILRATESGGSYTLQTSPEFYDDGWSIASGGRSNDSGAGGLAVLPGTNDVLYGTSDTLSAYSGGVIFFDTTNGSRLAGQEVYQSSSSPTDGSFAKAGGLGDLEMICAPTVDTIEIGNRVWLDTNENGVQDPSEPGLSDVTVTLIGASGSVTTTTTADDPNTAQNEAGQFLFSNAGGGNAVDILTEDDSFTISVDLSQPAVGGRAVTTGTSATNDQHDNDAIETGGMAEITLTSPAFGSNHSYDIGLVAPTADGTITIIKNTEGTDATFDFSSTDADLGAVSITTSSGTGSSAVFSKMAGTYIISEDALAGWNLTGISFSGDTDGGSSTIGSVATIDLDVGEDIIVTFSNEPVAADLSLTKSANAAVAQSGDTIVYLITVTNAGPRTATGVQITDQLPAGVTYDSHSASTGTYTSSTGVWSIASLPIGVATLTISVTVD